MKVKWRCTICGRVFITAGWYLGRLKYGDKICCELPLNNTATDYVSDDTVLRSPRISNCKENHV